MNAIEDEVIKSLSDAFLIRPLAQVLFEQGIVDPRRISEQLSAIQINNLTQREALALESARQWIWKFTVKSPPE